MKPELKTYLKENTGGWILVAIEASGSRKKGLTIIKAVKSDCLNLAHALEATMRRDYARHGWIDGWDANRITSDEATALIARVAPKKG
jgi:hypothetical protein